jgi:uncharacterized protein (DUF2252 family)
MSKQSWSGVACATALVAVMPWSAGADAAVSRTSEVVALIRAANAGLSSADRAEKYAGMKASSWAFFRGSNVLYWHDFATSPQLALYGGTAATRTFLGGDMHVENLGAFDDDQGEIVYAINDFDEAVIGDYQLDLWRAAVSVVLVARGNGLARSLQASALDTFTEAYLDAMASYATSSAETTRKVTAANSYGLLDDFLRQVAADESRAKMLDRWTVKVGGVRSFATATNSDLAAVAAAVDADVRGKMSAYRATLSGGGSFSSSFFTVKSVAQRLHAGLGSLGALRYYVLLEGPSASQDDDRILDVKAQGLPSAAAYLPSAVWAHTQSASGGNQAQRAALAAKALGYRVDDLLGTVTLSDGRTYSVRERSPYKATFDNATLTSATRLSNLAAQWGELLATVHARADRDWNAAVFPASLDAEVDWLTDGDHAGVRALVQALALDYADQVELDYASFLANF